MLLGIVCARVGQNLQPLGEGAVRCKSIAHFVELTPFHKQASSIVRTPGLCRELLDNPAMTC